MKNKITLKNDIMKSIFYTTILFIIFTSLLLRCSPLSATQLLIDIRKEPKNSSKVVDSIKVHLDDLELERNPDISDKYGYSFVLPLNLQSIVTIKANLNNKSYNYAPIKLSLTRMYQDRILEIRLPLVAYKYDVKMVKTIYGKEKKSTRSIDKLLYEYEITELFLEYKFGETIRPVRKVHNNDIRLLVNYSEILYQLIVEEKILDIPDNLTDRIDLFYEAIDAITVKMKSKLNMSRVTKALELLQGLKIEKMRIYWEKSINYEHQSLHKIGLVLQYLREINRLNEKEKILLLRSLKIQKIHVLEQISICLRKLSSDSGTKKTYMASLTDEAFEGKEPVEFIREIIREYQQELLFLERSDLNETLRTELISMTQSGILYLLDWQENLVIANTQ